MMTIFFTHCYCNMNEETKRITIAAVVEAAPMLAAKETELPDDIRFYELGIDSIGMLAILLKLEERLAVSLASLGDQLEAPVTFGDLCKLVVKLQETKQ